MDGPVEKDYAIRIRESHEETAVLQIVYELMHNLRAKRKFGINEQNSDVGEKEKSEDLVQKVKSLLGEYQPIIEEKFGIKFGEIDVTNNFEEYLSSQFMKDLLEQTKDCMEKRKLLPRANIKCNKKTKKYTLRINDEEIKNKHFGTLLDFVLKGSVFHELTHPIYNLLRSETLKAEHESKKRINANKLPSVISRNLILEEGFCDYISKSYLSDFYTKDEKEFLEKRIEFRRNVKSEVNSAFQAVFDKYEKREISYELFRKSVKLCSYVLGHCFFEEITSAFDGNEAFYAVKNKPELDEILNPELYIQRRKTELQSTELKGESHASKH